MEKVKRSVLLIDGGCAGKKVKNSKDSFLMVCYDEDNFKYYEQAYFVKEISAVENGNVKRFFFGTVDRDSDYIYILNKLIENFKNEP